MLTVFLLMNDSKAASAEGGSFGSGRSDGRGMAHFRFPASRPRRTGSAGFREAADSQWHPVGSAHGRAVARHAGALWPLELGVRSLTRWSKLGVWDAAFETLASVGPPENAEHAIDSTIVRAHQHAAGVKGGIKIRRLLGVRAAASRLKSTCALTPKAGRSSSS